MPVKRYGFYNDHISQIPNWETESVKWYKDDIRVFEILAVLKKLICSLGVAMPNAHVLLNWSKAEWDVLQCEEVKKR